MILRKLLRQKKILFQDLMQFKPFGSEVNTGQMKKSGNGGILMLLSMVKYVYSLDLRFDDLYSSLVRLSKNIGMSIF